MVHFLGAAAKVHRAKQHVEHLKSIVAAFRSQKPYQAILEEDLERRRRVYRVTHLEDLPIEFSLVTGDVIHNLRSALDHVAYEAVMSGLGEPPPHPERICFPIASSYSKYLSLRHDKLKGAKPRVVETIDALKPYEGEENLLWSIHKLDITDKHRTLLTVTAAEHSVDIGPMMKKEMEAAILEAEGEVVDIPLFPLALREDPATPLKVDDELFEYSLDEPFHAHPVFMVQVAFAEPEVWMRPVDRTLDQMTALVDDIVNKIEPLI